MLILRCSCNFHPEVVFFCRIDYAFNMKLRQYSTLTFALVGLGLITARAASADNPYQAIVTRNVFGLVPIPETPPPQSTKPNDASLPKITPNGIMTIFGKLQVLFKVAEPGKAASQEDSYIMSEGDRQDDIVVQKIDEKSATITFNNHGTIQELALVAGKASSGAPAPTVAPVPVTGQMLLPRPTIPRPNQSGLSAAASGSRNASNLAANNSPGGGAATETLPAGRQLPGGNISSQTPMTTEEQVILIEAQRLKALEDGNPIANILPPTELTSQTLGQDGSGSGSGTPPPPPAPGQ